MMDHRKMLNLSGVYVEVPILVQDKGDYDKYSDLDLKVDVDEVIDRKYTTNIIRFCNADCMWPDSLTYKGKQVECTNLQFANDFITILVPYVVVQRFLFTLMIGKDASLDGYYKYDYKTNRIKLLSSISLDNKNMIDVLLIKEIIDKNKN